MYESWQFCRLMVRNCQNESKNSAERLIAIERGCNFAFFTHYVYVKKGHFVVFLIFYSKGYVDVTRIYVTLKTF